MTILLGICTFVLILTSFFIIFVVLLQPAKSDGGMGAAMGGGVAEATFGSDTGNVLSKATINGAIVFFVLSFLLYLGRIHQNKHASVQAGGLPSVSAIATPAKPAAAPASSATVSTPAPAAAPAAASTAKP